MFIKNISLALFCSNTAGAHSRFAGGSTSRLSSHTARLSMRWRQAALVCAAFLILQPSVFAQAVPFVSTGPLNMARLNHEATLLQNGLVLISDGQVTSGTSTPELYDPAKGTFSLAGTMVSPRLFGTATLLQDGRVLFTGGFDTSTGSNQPVLATAELYDPSKGTFTATGPMSTPRVQHTATLLQNGTVLIAGGRNYSQGLAGETDLNTAELYDPSKGTFISLGTMAFVHFGAAAVLLGDGTVLIMGGADPTPLSNAYINSTELYDPVKNTFTPTGNMLSARYLHSALLLKDGSVFVAGGEHGPPDAEVYNPALKSFKAAGPMVTPRTYFAAAVLNDGQVLLTGGASLPSGTLVNTAELYDPVQNTFAQAGCIFDSVTMVYGPGCMTVSRDFHTATLLDSGKVLVAGGQGSANVMTLATAELYDLPAVSVTPATVDFGNQTTGIASAPQNVAVTNNLSKTVNFSAIALAGTNPGDFSQTNNCGMSLAGGAGCIVGVTFTPSALGGRSASLTFTDDAAGSPQAASLSGTGIAPAPVVSLSVPSLTFTTQMVNSTSASQQITLRNTGTAPLLISSIMLTGANHGDFAQTNTCGSQVAASSSCLIAVNFTPTAVGTRTAAVTITDNAADSPESVALTGNAVAPIALLSGATASFGSVPLGSSSPSQFLVLDNTGTATLTISGISIAGTNPGDFTETNSCGSSVAAGSGSCEIFLTFTPLAGGARTATLTIVDNAAGSPHTATLSGTGLPPVAAISSASISFPNQFVGTSGLPQSVTLSNTGAGLLTITSITSSSPDFAPLNACGASLAAGSSCSIGIFFDPSAAGPRTGTLTINDNSAGSPQAVSLSGTGEDFSLGPISLTTATVAPGQPATFSLSAAPAGGFNQSVSFSCAGAPPRSTCTVSPNPLTLTGSATTVTVTVATTANSRISLRPLAGGSRARPVRRIFVSVCALFGLFLVAALAGWNRARRPAFVYALSVLLMLGAGIALTACGGSGGGYSTGGGSSNNGTPAGTYTLGVSATFANGGTNLVHTTKLTVIVQ